MRVKTAHIPICAYISAHSSEKMHILMRTCVYDCACMCVQAYMHACMHVRACTCIVYNMHTCVSVCVSVCACKRARAHV